MAQKIFSIVVTYNGAPWLAQCLTSLRNSSYPTHIIVVDNASTDNSREITKSFPSVELIELHSNAGFAKANNIGICRAIEQGADFVFLLNQDAWIDKDMFEQLIVLANKIPKIGILSPLHWNGERSALDGNFAANLFSGTQAKQISELTHTGELPIHEVSLVNAAAWLLPSAIIKKLGGFDPIFFMYGEDDDYCQRVKWHGYKIVVSLNANAYHARGMTVAPPTPWRIFQQSRNRARSTMIMLLKNPNHSYLYNLARVLYFTCRRTIETLKIRKSEQVLGLWIAQLLILTELFDIYQRRRLSMKIGMHWLINDN